MTQLDTQTNEEIRSRLIQLVKDKEWSRADFARACDMSRGNATDVLDGNRNLSPRKLANLRRNAGVDLNWLIVGE